MASEETITRLLANHKEDIDDSIRTQINDIKIKGLFCIGVLGICITVCLMYFGQNIHYEMGNMRQEFRDTAAAHNASINTINTRIDALNESVQVMNGSIKAMNESLNARIDAMIQSQENKENSELKKRVTVLEEKCTANIAKMVKFIAIYFEYKYVKPPTHNRRNAGR